MIYVILLFYSFSGQIRNYLHIADQLFLWQKKEWMTTLQSQGFIHSIITGFFKTILVFLLLAPLLSVYLSYSWLQITGLFTFIWLMKIAALLTKRMIVLTFSSVAAYLLNVLLFGMMFFIYLGVTLMINQLLPLLAVLLAILVIIRILINRLLNRPLPFDKACALEMERQLRLTQFFLAIGTVYG